MWVRKLKELEDVMLIPANKVLEKLSSDPIRHKHFDTIKNMVCYATRTQKQVVNEEKKADSTDSRVLLSSRKA